MNRAQGLVSGRKGSRILSKYFNISWQENEESATFMARDVFADPPFTKKTDFIIYKFTISSFCISQWTVKARIIANFLKKIKNTEFVLIFKWKWFKYTPENGHFGDKWQFLPTWGTNWRVQNGSQNFTCICFLYI